MSVDVPTLLAYSAALLAVIGGLLAAFWARASQDRWFLWCSLPFLLAACGLVLLLVPALMPAGWAARLGAALILLAYGFGWQTIRMFDGRSPHLAWVVLPVVAWFGTALLLPGSWQFDNVNTAARAALVACFNGLAAWELWRGRVEELPARRLLVRMLAFYAALSALRVPLAGLLPAPIGALPTQGWSVVVYNLAMMTQALSMAALMIALSRERVSAQNRRLALRDPLTDLGNRRAFAERAAALAKQPGGAGTSLSLLLCDIDRFKFINDRFGHPTGDAVIQLAARTAERVFGQPANLFRVGGEEFVCLLPQTGAEQAFLQAERFRLAFQADAVMVAGALLDATLSIGIATEQHDGCRPTALLARADQALYEAKRAGRNQCALAEEVPLFVSPPD